MAPHQSLAEVVQPNVEDAVAYPGELRHVCNAFQSMDALMGITFWHRHERHDYRTTMHRDDDSAFKSDLAVSSQEIHVLTNAAYSPKHGRLTWRSHGEINFAGDGRAKRGRFFPRRRLCSSKLDLS